METKMIRVPFEVELAKKITNGEVGGRIMTRNGESVRIVCFNRKDEFRPIIALINSGDIEVHYAFSLNGKFVNDDVLDTHDLMLEIPEYMTFKDGDVIVCDKSVLLFSGDVNQYDLCGCYCSLFGDTESLDLNFDYKGVFPETRLATETEKQKLIDALKSSKEPKAKECLKRFFNIEQKQECEFKPFDKVMVRDADGVWFADIFSHYSNSSGYKYKTVGAGSWECCIPYNEETAHLLGTTENYE